MSPARERVEDALAELRFDGKWLECGLLNESFLLAQLERYQRGEDAYIEHYHYAALRTALAERLAMSDAGIGRYVELAVLDEDRAMATPALLDLLPWEGLTGERFERLVKLPRFTGLPSRRAVEKRWKSRAERFCAQ